MKAISKEKIAAALKQEELGVPLEDIIREMGVSRETYLGWRRSHLGNAAAAAGMPAAEPPSDSDIPTPRAPEDE